MELIIMTLLGIFSRFLRSFSSLDTIEFVYIWSRQKLIKNLKNGPFWRVFENLKLAVLPDNSLLIGQQLVENAKSQNTTF